MVVRLAAGVLCLAACSFELDVPGAVEPPSCTWTPRHLDACQLAPAQPALALTTELEPYVYDTTAGGGVLTDRNREVVATSDVTAPQAGGPLLAVLNVEGFSLGADTRLFVIGDKPLVIAAWTTVSIAGTINAGSTTAELDPVARIDGPDRTGAGADPSALCAGAIGSSGGDAVASGGSGGGGGGAFSGEGGRGGIGDTTMQPGGPGGLAVAIPTVIRGGCSGGDSGTAGTGIQLPATPTTIARGGHGGGAIEIAARMTIEISGTITAGGAGGAGAPQGSAVGGGGGGAGGYIGLDAPRVVVTSAVIAANGGGGGGSAPFAGNGNQGNNANDGARADGGAISGGTCGLAGGAGSFGADRNGGTNALNDSCGGGGGGGAAGYVLVWAPTLELIGETVSPALQPGP